MGPDASVFFWVSPSAFSLFFASFFRIFFIFLSRTRLSSGVKSSSPSSMLASSWWTGGSEVCHGKTKQRLMGIIYTKQTFRCRLLSFCAFVWTCYQTSFNNSHWLWLDDNKNVKTIVTLLFGLTVSVILQCSGWFHCALNKVWLLGKSKCDILLFWKHLLNFDHFLLRCSSEGRFLYLQFMRSASDTCILCGEVHCGAATSPQRCIWNTHACYNTPFLFFVFHNNCLFVRLYATKTNLDFSFVWEDKITTEIKQKNNVTL